MRELSISDKRLVSGGLSFTTSGLLDLIRNWAGWTPTPPSTPPEWKDTGPGNGAGMGATLGIAAVAVGAMVVAAVVSGLSVFSRR